MPYGKRRLLYKCYSLWLKFTSLKGNPRLLLRRWWWIISFGGLLQAPESGTWRSLHSAPAAFCFSRARAPPSRLAPPIFLFAPPSSLLQPPSTEALSFRAPAHCACAASGRFTFPEVGGPRSSLCGRRRGNASPVIFQPRKSRLSRLAGWDWASGGSSSSLLTWHATWRMSRPSSLATRPWLPRGARLPGRSAGTKPSVRILRWESARVPLN